MTWKYLKGSHHGLIKVLFYHCLKEGEESHRKPQDSWSPTYELEHSPICHGYSLLNQLLSLMALEYMDDFQIERLCTEILGFRTLSIVRIFLNNNEKTQCFRNWICFRPQVREDTYSVGSLRKIRTMDKVRKPNISVCYTPLSEPYSIYWKAMVVWCS
jgi:hypothetical protein